MRLHDARVIANQAWKVSLMDCVAADEESEALLPSPRHETESPGTLSCDRPTEERVI